MERSESITELAVALAKAQGEFPPLHPNKQNKFIGNKYADLSAVIENTRPSLAANGLSVLQIPEINEGFVTIKTVLLHVSGEFISSELTMEGENLGKGNNKLPMTLQAYASSISYVRRYAYQSIICVATGDDDDGNTGSGRTEENPQGRTQQRTSSSAFPACPKCGKTSSVIKGKEEYGGGWLCFKKKEGCGHKWQDDPKPATDEQRELMKKIVQSHVFNNEERTKIIGVADDAGSTMEDVNKGIDWLKKTSAYRKKQEKAEPKLDDTTQQDYDLVKNVLGVQKADALKKALTDNDDDTYIAIVQEAHKEKDNL